MNHKSYEAPSLVDLGSIEELTSAVTPDGFIPDGVYDAEIVDAPQYYPLEVS